MFWSEGTACPEALARKRTFIQGTERGLESKGRGARDEGAHVSVCPCPCLFPVRDRQVRQRRLPCSGLESRAGVVRILWRLSFAICKMGIASAAFAPLLPWNSDELVDLNPKGLPDLSSMSGCAHDHVGAHASVSLGRELPVTPFSCRDKSAASSVSIHPKHTRFWPRAMLSNSPGGGGEWRRRSARWGPALLGEGGHLVSLRQTLTMQGDKGHL